MFETLDRELVEVRTRTKPVFCQGIWVKSYHLNALEENAFFDSFCFDTSRESSFIMKKFSLESIQRFIFCE